MPYKPITNYISHGKFFFPWVNKQSAQSVPWYTHIDHNKIWHHNLISPQMNNPTSHCLCILWPYWPKSYQKCVQTSLSPPKQTILLPRIGDYWAMLDGKTTAFVKVWPNFSTSDWLNCCLTILYVMWPLVYIDHFSALTTLHHWPL